MARARRWAGAVGSVVLLLPFAPLAGPITGGTTFNAHYMLTKNAMLEEGTYKVYKLHRQTPYDPRNAEDGYVFPDRPEGHFAIWGQGAYEEGYAVPDPAPETTPHRDTATGAGYRKTYDIPVIAVMSHLAVEVQVTAGVGQLDAAPKDPEGEVLDSDRATPTSPARLSASGPFSLGNHTLEVTGLAVQATYSATVTVDPPAPFLLHVIYVNVEVVR